MQPESYRHDYTAVEQRLRQLRAPADRHRHIGLSVLALSLAAAACALMLSAGYAWHLATAPAQLERIVERVVPAPPPAPIPAPAFPDVPEATGADAGIVTTDYSLFRNTETEIRGRAYQVTAGHRFLSEADTTFTSAWCYTRILADGISVSVDLGTLDPGAAAVKAPVSSATLALTGLSRADHATLFAACPWLPGNPNVTARAATEYRFTGEVTAESVDRLIAAVEAGVTRVDLTSPGGSLGDAMRGFEALSRAGVDTIASGPCASASACTLLFLAGRSREVASRGAIGVHQWQTELGVASEQDAQILSADLVGLIAAAGVSQEFYVAAARTPAEEIRVLTRHEMRSWGVVREGDES